MKKIGLIVAVMMAMALPAWGQISNPSIIYTASAPSGSCVAAPPVYVLTSTGAVYTCNNGTWGIAPSSVAAQVALTSKSDNTNYYLLFAGANSSTSQGVDVGPATYNPSTNTSNVNTTGKAATVDSLASLTNGASPVNMSAPGLTVNAVANAAAPTSSGATSGGTAGVSATNEAALTCLDSGGNTTLGVASANVVTITANQTIPWTFAAPTGCANNTAYLWMKASGSFAFYTTITLPATTFTQSAAATTYTAAASYPGGVYPATNTTGLINGTPAAYFDATSSIQTQLNGKAASGAATTVNGQSCALGGSCTVVAAAVNLAASGAGGVTGNLPQAQVAAGTSTPFALTDASTGALTFTSIAVVKSLNGNLATVQGQFTYPAQASPYQAKFNLPYVAQNVNSALAICQVVSSYATPLVIEIPNNTSLGYLYTSGGNALMTNASLTGAQVQFTCNYLTQ